ncbi:protein kinase [Cystobacter fuscus]|nr:protein kinase [Cystobacter fuscus]
MAELFLGKARGAGGFEKPVAIKRMLPHLARDPTLARMFLAEARLATHLQHQNIASVYDVGSGAEGLFLVMELVEGWDLSVLLSHALRHGQRFPPHLVAFIGTQVLAGLVHAYRRLHEGRPVLTAHRDVSPSNILVSREGEVKVTDFGIARIEGVSVGSQPGTFKGKLPYSAPEVLQGEPATATSDQFALGVVLHELLSGRHPFEPGESAEPMALALAIIQQEPAPLPEEVPPSLSAVILRALARDPAQRFPRPEDMAEALSRYLAQSGEPTSSHALAGFIAQLHPPPTLLEGDGPAEQPHAQTHTLPHLTLSPNAMKLPDSELPPEEDWDEVPGGPALNTSGQVVRTEPEATPPLAWRCGHCHAPLPEDGARCPRCGQTQPPVITPLGRDNTPLELASPSRTPQRAEFSPRELGGPHAAHAAPPRLAERTSRPDNTYVPVDMRGPWRRRLRSLLTMLLVLGAVGGALWVAWPHAQPLLARLRATSGLAPPTAAILSIQSTPSGATVSVDGKVVGTTPLFIDNIYPEQDVPVRLTLKGYKPWKGTFTGNQPVSLDIQLKR